MNYSPLDFYVENIDKTQAFILLWKLYPRYSYVRRVLRYVNLVNIACLRRMPETYSLIREKVRFHLDPDSQDGRVWMLHKVRQNGRSYLFNLNSRGDIVSVTKIAINPKGALGITKEYEVLKKIKEFAPQFWIPEVFEYQTFDEGCLLCISFCPSKYSIHDKKVPMPEGIFEVIKSMRQLESSSQLHADKIDGWQPIIQRTMTPLIRGVAEQIDGQSLFSVSAAHRDLGSENVLSCAPYSSISDFALIDWELFTDTAPELTDYVGVWLGRRHRLFKALRQPDIHTIAGQFLRDFKDMPGGEKAAVLALLHLAEADIDLAKMLIGYQQ